MSMSKAYSNYERMIARFLSNLPFLKKIVKKYYSYVVYVFSKRKEKLQSDFEVKLVLKEHEQETFFGYFDKSPVNNSGFTLLHLSELNTTKLPSNQQSISIAVVGPQGGKRLVTSSFAYNWQQGTRAHWINDDNFIFNDYDQATKEYISRVYSIQTMQQTRRFSFSVQDSYKDQYFLALNYRRLMAMRPDYGYRNLPALTEEELQQTDNDGIWKVSIETGQSELLLSIDNVKAIDHQSSFDNATHKVNHVSISRSGEHFIFLHRYFVGQRRVDRLMVSTTDGKEVKTLAAYGMVSHCFWADDSTILGYLRGPGEKDAYWLIDIHTGNMTHFANGVLDSYGDGHPHVVGDWFITDTYPDKARMQYLMLCNWKTGEVKRLGEFFHGFNFNGETRCDLHPRMSPDGNSVFFDSVFSGKRQLYRISLN